MESDFEARPFCLPARQALIAKHELKNMEFNGRGKVLKVSHTIT
jgi:hypothetical protein